MGAVKTEIEKLKAHPDRAYARKRKAELREEQRRRFRENLEGQLKNVRKAKTRALARYDAKIRGLVKAIDQLK